VNKRRWVDLGKGVMGEGLRERGRNRDLGSQPVISSGGKRENQKLRGSRQEKGQAEQNSVHRRRQGRHLKQKNGGARDALFKDSREPPVQETKKNR